MKTFVTEVKAKVDIHKLWYCVLDVRSIVKIHSIIGAARLKRKMVSRICTVGGMQIVHGKSINLTVLW